MEGVLDWPESDMAVGACRAKDIGGGCRKVAGGGQTMCGVPSQLYK